MTAPRLERLCLFATLAIALASSGCGSGAGGDADAASRCGPATCADGCCDGELCVASSITRCGGGGAACADCSLDNRSDSCAPAGCVCAADGVRCSPSQVCTETGCIFCESTCTGKCAGADDGCGIPCPTNQCEAGCCDANLDCVRPADQSDTECGNFGMLCANCVEVGESCHAGLSICTSPLANDAEILGHTMPDTMTPGQQRTVSVIVRNTGTATWTGAAGYKLGAQNPQDNAIWGLARVDLAAGASIAPGGTLTFDFQVTAPASPGIYNFQWRMLRESVEWFGDYSIYLPVVVGGGSATVCEAARALAGADTDATAVIQGCIDAAPAGDIVELPPGVYSVDGKLQIAAAAITLRTEGKTLSDAPCAIADHDCAELAASTAFADTGGVLQVTRAGSVVDHLVVNGNKTARASTPSGSQCAAYSNSYGYNMRVACDDCTVANSVSKNALCGTGLEISGTGTGVVAWRNSIADNGVHDAAGMWSDGITVHDYAGSTFVANTFRDNTDVDFIFGGCQGCIVQDNRLDHGPSFPGSSFAALMLHAWPGGATSGDFTGTDVSRNRIDCGVNFRCGFGLYLGPDAWYDADTFGGAVHHNVVVHAEQGVLIDDAHDMQVFNNYVAAPDSTTAGSCGVRATGAYGIGTTSVNIDTSRDTMGTTYDAVNWDGCIPNWWQ